MGQDSELALALAGGVRPTAERTPESPLVPGERRLDGTATMPPKVEVGWPGRPATGPIGVYRAGRGFGFLSLARRALLAHVRGSWCSWRSRRSSPASAQIT